MVGRQLDEAGTEAPIRWIVNPMPSVVDTCAIEVYVSYPSGDLA
jgi:hypothetical protein